jgi:hypothetical protein
MLVLLGVLHAWLTFLCYMYLLDTIHISDASDTPRICKIELAKLSRKKSDFCSIPCEKKELDWSRTYCPVTSYLLIWRIFAVCAGVVAVVALALSPSLQWRRCRFATQRSNCCSCAQQPTDLGQGAVIVGDAGHREVREAGTTSG